MKINRNTFFAILMVIILLSMISFYLTSLNDQKQASSYPVYSCKHLPLGCKGMILNKEIKIRFPENIIFLQKFPIEVHVDDNNFTKVIVDFQMVGMNMGFNLFHLQQNVKDKNIWTGAGVLPFCTTGRTDWQVIISLYEGDKVVKVAFQFEVNAITQK